MSDRLTKIVTRTGDNGTTSLANLERRKKNDIRIEALGELDELNAHLGVLTAMTIPPDMVTFLIDIQQYLCDIAAEIALPNRPASENFSESSVQLLEAWINNSQANLPSLKEFLLPGGHLMAAQAHVCRTVCRRVERTLISLHEKEDLSPPILTFINRLSDALFVAARLLNQLHQTAEPIWRSYKVRNESN